MPSSTRIRLGITMVHGTQNVRYSIGPATTGAVSLQSRPTPHLRWLSFKFSLIQGHASDATGSPAQAWKETRARDNQASMPHPVSCRMCRAVPCFQRAATPARHRSAVPPNNLPNKLAPANRTNFTCGKSITPSWMVSYP